MLSALSSTNRPPSNFYQANRVSLSVDNFFSRLTLCDEQPYRLGRHVLFWVTCWVFMGFIYGALYVTDGRYHQLAVAYLEAIIYLPQHMLLSYGIIYFILPRYILRGNFWLGLLSVLLLILFVSFLSPVIANFVITPLRQVLHVPIRPAGVLYLSLLAGLRGSMTVAGFAVAIKLIKLWYLKKVDNERLEKATLRAELELLKGQLHPHFMFNTLNSIYSLALKKSDYTPDAILKLSQLMRYMLMECSTAVTDLQKEVQILHHYIDLEKSRFGDRLDITLNIRGDIHRNRIPPLILMPFLENSFKHGANEMIDQAWISLDLNVEGSILKFKLINGKPETPSTTESSHVGLLNVKRRLELLYPEAHELRITEDPDTFVVGLTIELDRIQLPEAS